MSDKLKAYAVNSLSSILPLDRDTCLQMVDYALTLPTDDDVRTHFLNLLGESDDSLTFIGNFIKRRHQDTTPLTQNAKSGKGQRQLYEQLHAKHAPQKSDFSWGAKQEALIAPPKPTKPSSKPVKPTTTSELLPSKADPRQVSVKRSKKKNLDNLKDIESILNDLEISEDYGAGRNTMRVCNCMATRHPLFEVAPNCLNCGKIICAKEGLQPCLFCGKELLSGREKQDIILVLAQERQGLEERQPDLKRKLAEQRATAAAAATKPKLTKFTISMNAGENMWTAQDRALKQADAAKKAAAEKLAQQEQEQQEIASQQEALAKYERTLQVDPALVAAQERLDTLLEFQATGAERTRIIDNASDFDVPSGSSGSVWLSPTERAVQLKKQQRQMRKQTVAERERSGRGEKVLEMVIRNGKVTMVEKAAPHADPVEHDEDIADLEARIRQKKQMEEESAAQNVWDYENDTDNWERPVYQEGKETTQPQAPAPLPTRSRVHFFNDLETNELLA
jgi:hypothetical protein